MARVSVVFNFTQEEMDLLSLKAARRASGAGGLRDRSIGAYIRHLISEHVRDNMPQANPEREAEVDVAAFLSEDFVDPPE